MRTTPEPAGGPRTLGIVGAGQLARMTCEAASALGVRSVVLAASDDDAAVPVASEVVLGGPSDEGALARLARRADVVTFDHEQVDLAQIAELVAAGTLVRPGPPTLRLAVDKAVMRAAFDAAGLPVPAYEVLGVPGGGQGACASAVVAEATEAVAGFARRRGWPVVLKAARGGYDGKGVWPVADEAEAARVCEQARAARTPLLVEEHVPIDLELATVVARRPGGDSVSWPAVETAQLDGMCREVRYPGSVDPALARRAADLALEVASVAQAVGVLAVELFCVEGDLLVNEIAARPHNSAHWTIEGSLTSQFENHLRAVLDLPLGSTAPLHAHVASVNVLGGERAGAGPADGLADALAVEGAHVHLYGKVPRPGRKLGHVTVCGDDADEVRTRAWAAALALGTPVPASIRAAVR